MRFLIFALIFFGITCDQGIIKQIKKVGEKGKEKKELTHEIETVFKKVVDLFEEDLNKVDTLFIIRGIDIQNRNASGRLWNNKVVFHYLDEKIAGAGKILKSNPKISRLENFTPDFDDLIRAIENGDKEKVIEYSEEHRVQSGVYWRILTFKKKPNGKYESELYSVSDFALIK